MEHEQLSYPDALRYLAKKYNIEIKERELSDEEKQAQSERESMFIVNEWACQFFQDQLSNTVDGRAIGMAYFRSRGFRDDIIKKFSLGFSPTQRDALAKEAKNKGYKESYLLSTGLCYKRENGQLQDRFFGRVIFPVHTLSGKVVAFGGRVLDAATKGVSVKYQNSPESSIYSKKKELYGLFQAKQAIVKQDLCFLVEGYTDVISMHQMGVENVVSSSGTALTTDQIRMIHRFTDNITVLYDGDAAGIKASERGIDMLLAEGMNVKLLLLPDGDDPDSFARKHNATEYQAYLNDHQTDFIKFKTDLLLKEAQGDPIKLSRLINSIVHSISVIPDEITRSVYVKQSALMLGLEERTLAIAIAKEITKAKEEKQKQKEREQNGAIRNEETPPSIPVPNIHHIPQDTVVPFPVTEDIPPLSENDIPSAHPDIAPITSADIPVEPQVSTENTYLPQQQTNDMAFYRKELLLMQMVIRHGEKVMCYTEDEKPLSVAEYIHYALKEDDIKLHTQLHTMILEEAMAHIQEEGFCSERFFLNHSDNRISMLAFELCDDKYQLSKYHSRGQKITSEEERLMELVPHLIDDFKLAIIKEDLKQILLKLRNPAILSHQEEYMKIMKHYKELKDIECILSKERGDRVIS
jgi:DNA primase